MPELRPIERRLIFLREQGKTFEELAPMFRRSPAHLERVLRYTEMKIVNLHRDRP